MRPLTLLAPALVTALCLSVPAPAPAQQRAAPPDLQVGDTVRVGWLGSTSPHSARRPMWHEGVVAEVRSDAVILDTEDGPRTISMEAVDEVEFRHERTEWEGFKRGFLVGGVAFGAAGVVLGGITGASCDGAFLFCPGPAGGAAILGGLFGLGGGLASGLLKAAFPGAEWRTAPIRLSAGAAPRGGAELRLRLSF